jgi:hypothetical protein
LSSFPSKPSELQLSILYRCYILASSSAYSTDCQGQRNLRIRSEATVQADVVGLAYAGVHV